MQDDIKKSSLKTENKTVKKKEKSFFKKVLKIFTFFVTSLLFIIILFLLLLQTSFVKNKILKIALDKINNGLKDKESVLFIESLEGNLFSSVKFNNISLVTRNDTLFKANLIEAHYSLLPLLDKIVITENITIDKPQVNFTKIRDKNNHLIWNFEYLIKSDKPEDTTKKEFDWDIQMKNLVITGCDIRFLADKNSELPIRMLKSDYQKYFNFDNLDISNLNLELDARYSRSYKSIELRKLNLNTNSAFNLHTLSFNANANDKGDVNLENFIYQTDNSNVIIKKIITKSFYPFDNFIYENLGDCDVETEIYTNRFDVADLDYVLPDLKLFRGKVFLDLKAKGKYKDIVIERLIARTRNSEVNITGNIKNLQNPGKITIDAIAKQCSIDPSDTKYNLPGIDIPDFSHVGKLSTTVLYRGDLNKFYSEYDVKSNTGNISGNTYLDISGKEVSYKTNNSFNSLNPGKLLKNQDLEADLNGNVKANGTGLNYKTLIADIDYELINSKFYKQNILQSSGKVKANHSVFNLDVKYNSSNVATQINGSVDINNTSNIKYDLKGFAKNLDVAGFTNSTKDKSNLNFNFDVKGQGTDLQNLNGNYTFQIFPSQYQNYIIPETPLLVTLNNSTSDKDINIKSNFLDFHANGIYSLNSLPGIIASNITRITNSFEKQFGIDSNYVINDKVSITDNYDVMNMRYSMVVKNFVPFNIILKDNRIKLTADLTGNITNNENNFTFTANGRIQNFGYGDSLTQFNNSLISVNINSPYHSNLSNNLLANASIKTDNIYVKGFKVDTLDFNVNLQNLKNNFYIRSKADTNVRILANGEIMFKENMTGLIFDTLNFGYRNYDLKNNGPIVLSYKITDTSKFIDLQNFSLSQDKQIVDLKGYYSFNSNSNLLFTASNIDLSDLSKSAFVKFDNADRIHGNIKYFKIKFEGTPEEPNLITELSTDNVKIDANSVGYIYAILKYKDNFLNPDIVLIDPVTDGKLLVTGKIPFNNPVVSDTLDFDFLNKKVNLNISADNYNITLLKYYVPANITDIRGLLKGNLAITGTGRMPNINGNMNIREGFFTLGLNGLTYGFNLDLNPQNQKLLVNNSRIFYPKETDRFITCDGFLDFTNLKLNNLDIGISGDVKVLDNRVTKNDLGFYGDLYAGSGNPYLRITGNSDYLLLSGNLVLKKGKVSMSANENRAFTLYDDNFIYKVQVDSNSFSKDSLKLLLAYLRDTISKNSYLNPFDEFLAKKDTLLTNNPVSGFKFNYDISITNSNNIFANFIVDEKTKQEFNGEVRATLYVDNKNNDSIEVRGRVDLEKNCTYKFYKVFNASGYVNFNGNPRNPELHINAIYSGKSPDPNNEGSTRDVTVRLDVTGDAAKPKLSWSILVNGNSMGGGDQTDQALSYIVFGKFKDELNASQRSNLFSSIGANVGANIISGYFSNFIQNILPFIVSTDINYFDNSTGNIMKGTDIRFTAEFGDATVRFGGQLFNDLSNTNFALDYPLNKFLRIKWLSNNLILSFERLVDPFTQNSSQFNTANRTGGLLLYKINF